MKQLPKKTKSKKFRKYIKRNYNTLVVLGFIQTVAITVVGTILVLNGCSRPAEKYSSFSLAMASLPEHKQHQIWAVLYPDDSVDCSLKGNVHNCKLFNKSVR